MSEEKHPYLNKIVAWRTDDSGKLIQCPKDHPDANLFDVYYPGVDRHGILSSGDHSFANEYDASWGYH